MKKLIKKIFKAIKVVAIILYWSLRYVAIEIILIGLFYKDLIEAGFSPTLAFPLCFVVVHYLVRTYRNIRIAIINYLDYGRNAHKKIVRYKYRG